MTLFDSTHSPCYTTRTSIWLESLFSCQTAVLFDFDEAVMKHALIVAGTHSGVGKTTISTALMAALSLRGLSVQGFKVGPDFIDPGFHKAATGRPSLNLDGWMLDRETNRRVFESAARGSTVSVIEGVMGLFDGASATEEHGSTAEMAKWLGLPVVLVIDASAQARSAAALVHGFESFDENLNLVAVIANRVAGEGHYRYIERAVRATCKAAPAGFLTRNPEAVFPSRHLGLVTASESLTEDRLQILADWIQSSIDLDLLLSLSTVPSIEGPQSKLATSTKPSGVRIGVARDQAFCFYYQENLDLLEQFGAELVFWSPTDEPLPTGLDGLYFGGGYPELNAAQLSSNLTARLAVLNFVEAGGVVYAECGGLMYLSEAIVDSTGARFPMAGVFPSLTRMHDRLASLGYVEIKGIGCPLLPVGESIRGHEFRHSSIDKMPDTIARSYRVRSARPEDELRSEGYVSKNCLGSYVHLHFLSNPRFAERWVELCRRSDITT